MLGMPWPKIGLLILLIVWISILVVGGVQKLRDREVGWKWSNAISRRNGRDPLGYWISASFNFVFAAAASALALAITFDRIPVTWGR